MKKIKLEGRIASYSKRTAGHKWNRGRVILHPTSSLQIRSPVTGDMGGVRKDICPIHVDRMEGRIHALPLDRA